jgi:hypothetical protein
LLRVLLRVGAGGDWRDRTSEMAAQWNASVLPAIGNIADARVSSGGHS